MLFRSHAGQTPLPPVGLFTQPHAGHTTKHHAGHTQPNAGQSRGSLASVSSHPIMPGLQSTGSRSRLAHRRHSDPQSTRKAATHLSEAADPNTSLPANPNTRHPADSTMQCPTPASSNTTNPTTPPAAEPAKGTEGPTPEKGYIVPKISILFHELTNICSAGRTPSPQHKGARRGRGATLEAQRKTRHKAQELSINQLKVQPQLMLW